MLVARSQEESGAGWGKREFGQRAQTSCYKMNKFWDLMYSKVTMVITYCAYLNVATTDLKNYHHEHTKTIISAVMEVLVLYCGDHFTEYIHTYKHHLVHLKLCNIKRQLYLKKHGTINCNH